MDGESSERGIELMTRSDASGLFFVGWGGGDAALGEGDGGDDGGVGVLTLRASLAASSHAARAEGLTGQADGWGTFEVCWIWLEEVFPMFLREQDTARFAANRDKCQAKDGKVCRDILDAAMLQNTGIMPKHRC